MQYDIFLVISIFVNILLILGCSGKKWRRALAFPWLIFYGNDLSRVISSVYCNILLQALELSLASGHTSTTHLSAGGRKR